MRVAVISDVHSNLRALEAVLAAIGSVDAIWQLGDVVGYGPDPDAVVARLREAGAAGVRGNHDAAVLGDVSTEDFNSAARAAVEWTRERLRPDSREYLAALPERLVPGRPTSGATSGAASGTASGGHSLAGGGAASGGHSLAGGGAAGGDFTLVHGSPRDPIWEYLTETWVARANMAEFDTRFCLVGHSHLPLLFGERRGHVKGGPVRGGAVELGAGRAILNPGSVGQPRDGDSRAACLIVDTDAGTAEWLRVPYDIAATQAAMVSAGLPASLARRLGFGR